MKSGYQFLSGFSFLVSGNIIQANLHKGFFGWWNIPTVALLILGYAFMDAYAKRYHDSEH